MSLTSLNVMCLLSALLNLYVYSLSPFMLSPSLCLSFLPYLHYIKIKPNEKVVGLDQIDSLSDLAPSAITYLCLADVTLQKKKLKALPKALCQFTNIEILLLRGLGLSALPNCKFPNLRFLDLSHNSFSKVANIINVIKHSPNLEIINILYNPCAYREDVVGRMLTVCMYLVCILYILYLYNTYILLILSNIRLPYTQCFK